MNLNSHAGLLASGVIHGLRRAGHKDSEIAEMLGIPPHNVAVAARGRRGLSDAALDRLEAVTSKSAAMWALDALSVRGTNEEQRRILRDAKRLIGASAKLAKRVTRSSATSRASRS